MKRLVLFLLLIPLVSFGQEGNLYSNYTSNPGQSGFENFSRYIFKLMSEKGEDFYKKNVYYQTYEIDNPLEDIIGKIDVVEENIKIDGTIYLLSEKRCTWCKDEDDESNSWLVDGYPADNGLISIKTYDYSPNGPYTSLKRYLYSSSNYNFHKIVENKSKSMIDGVMYEGVDDIFYFPDGIWETNELPYNIRNRMYKNWIMGRSGFMNWDQMEKEEITFYKPMECWKLVFIAGTYIEDLNKDKESGCSFWKPGYDGLIKPEKVNEFNLQEMVNVFLTNLENTFSVNKLGMNGKSYKDQSFVEIDGKYVYDPSVGNGKDYALTVSWWFLEKFISNTTIDATFEILDKGVLGLSMGIFDNDKIILKINAEEWKNATSLERWYTIYHELGHDVLNLQHGEGGKMMFNFSIDKDYTWEDFFKERDEMFETFYKTFDPVKFISNPNITTKNLEINKEDAIKELKSLKELLDLELITQEEFDKKSKELKKIILGN